MRVKGTSRSTLETRRPVVAEFALSLESGAREQTESWELEEEYELV